MGVITIEAMGAADDIVVVVPVVPAVPVVVPVVPVEFAKGPLDTVPKPSAPSAPSPFPPPPPKLTTAKIIPTTIAITMANAPALINLPLLLSARFN